MLGAIVKSVGGKLVKQQAKKVAKDKLMGRKKKPTASKKTAENMVSGGASTAIEKRKSGKTLAKTDGRRGYKGPSLEVVKAEIDAKETDARMVKISKDVTAIAEAMKGGLVLKDKAAQKERKAAEKDKRAAQEAKTEKPDKPKKRGGGFPSIKVPGVGLLDGIFGFITKFLYGIVILKLIEFVPKLKGVLGAIKKVGEVLKFVFGPAVAGAGLVLQGLISLVDFGYTLVDGAERIVGKIFGEEGAKKFKTFIQNIVNLVNAFLVWKIIGKKIFTSVIKNIKNAFKLVKGFIKNVFGVAGFLLNGLASFVDFGYTLVDGAERIVGKIFGEEGAKKFKTFIQNIVNLVNKTS